MGIVWRKGLPLEDMEFFQFHPTGPGRAGHPAVGGAPAARAASCATRTASGSWSATRPPSRTSRRATSSPARWRTRSARAAAPGRTRTTCCSTCTHLRARADRRQAARHHRVRPHLPGRRAVHRAGAGPSRPRTTRWAASRPTSRARCCATTTDVVPGPVRRRRVRLRLGARREPPGHQLAAGHQRVRPAGRHRRRRVRRARAELAPSCRRHPATRGRPGRAAADAPPAPSGSPPSARDCRRRWTSTRRCTAPRRRSSRRRTTSRRSRSATSNVAVQRQGQAVQHRPAGGRRAGLPARPGRGDGRRRAGPQGVARRPLREDYPNRDDVNFMRHTMAYRDADATATIRLDYKPVVQTRYQPMERKY